MGDGRKCGLELAPTALPHQCGQVAELASLNHRVDDVERTAIDSDHDHFLFLTHALSLSLPIIGLVYRETANKRIFFPDFSKENVRASTPHGFQ